MANGVIIKVKRGYTGIIRGEEGRKYRFNRKRIVEGELRQVTVGRRVEYEPDGDWATQIRLLAEVVEVRAKKKSKTQPNSNSTTKPQYAPSQGYRFLNPYNFVRLLDAPRPKDNVLGSCSPPPHDRYIGLTGRITCTVEAITPLFISDSHAIQVETVRVNDKDVKHHTYRFFQLDDQPALPASSLRGMVRSVFETVTNSCFVTTDQDPLSYHFNSRRAPWLVPARVEHDGDEWRLRLLTGTTPLQIESPDRKSPEGKQYAAWNASYWPIKPSKTLRGIGPRRRKLSEKQLSSRQSFIERTKNPVSNPDRVKHGESCYALLRPFQHPHPKIQFWDVVQIRKRQEDLPTPGRGEMVVQGWLCITNQNIESKHSERFFFRAENNRTGPEFVDLPEEVRSAYEALIKDYQKRHRDAVQKRRQKHKTPDQPVGDDPAFSRFVYQDRERKLKGGELVYALLEGTVNAPRVEFIVPVSVPRVSYEHGVGDLLPDFLRQCRDINSLCPACRVFGWVRGAAEDVGHDVPTAYAGRVRFSHGTLVPSTGDELPDIPLAILSSPKPTTTAFYLLNAEGDPDATVDYDTENARLRGRKFYRHHGKQLSEQEYRRAEGIKDDQNRTIKGALKPGAMFKFTVDFENLAPLELGALLYALELENNMYHRLGYAKPLGFGSVKITAARVQIIDWETRLKSLEPDAGWKSLKETEWKRYEEDFLDEMRSIYGDDFEDVILSDLRALLGDPPNLPIHYPRVRVKPDSEGKNFEWFVRNKKRGEGAFPLPLGQDDKQGLPLLNKKGEKVT